MADYHAVLTRTLAGFSDANDQLRQKLYERARVTIKRQLEGRDPPLDEGAMQVEMDKLESAISEIEAGFTSGGAAPEADTASAEATQTEAPAPTTEPLEMPPESVAPEEPQEASATDALVEEEQPETAIDLPAEPEDTASSVAERAADALPEFEPTQPPASAETPLPPEPDQSSSQFVDPIAEALNELNAGAGKSTADKPAVSTSQSDAPSVAQASGSADEAPAGFEAFLEAETSKQAEPTPPAKAAPVPDMPDIDFSSASVEPDLFIPPATGEGSSSRKRNWVGRSILWLFVLAAIGALGFFGWQNQDKIAGLIGISDSEVEEAAKPKPVKTFKVRPEPAQPETSEEQTVPAPKREERLGEDGEEIGTTPGEGTLLQQNTGSDNAQATTGEGNTGGETSATAPTTRAILYEEGAQSGTGNLDNGAVTWSIVQEEPAPGADPEAAIRARMDIPDRDLTVVMTIKRNTDEQLPATHLIEMVFLLPEDFAGGGISAVNRFVMKGSEEERGDTLIAVPAKISDSIFLVALNNLDEARATNETLLKTRDWIDIPIQYNTGRRALVTLQKGEAGRKIFDDVFAQWAAKSQ